MWCRQCRQNTLRSREHQKRRKKEREIGERKEDYYIYIHTHTHACSFTPLLTLFERWWRWNTERVCVLFYIRIGIVFDESSFRASSSSSSDILSILRRFLLFFGRQYRLHSFRHVVRPELKLCRVHLLHASRVSHRAAKGWVLQQL